MMYISPGVFDTLRTIRDFERAELAFIRSLEDVDIVREIGFHQEAGKPLTLKDVYSLRLQPSLRDQRSFELLLIPSALKAYGRYVSLLSELDSGQGRRKAATAAKTD